jgi:hypothetical protein
LKTLQLIYQAWGQQVTIHYCPVASRWFDLVLYFIESR